MKVIRVDSAVGGRGLASTLAKKLPRTRTELGNSHTFAEEVSQPAPRTMRWKSSLRLVEHGEQEPLRKAHHNRHQRPAGVVETFVAEQRVGHRGRAPGVERGLAVDRPLVAAGSEVVAGKMWPVDKGTIAAASRGHTKRTRTRGRRKEDVNKLNSSCFYHTTYIMLPISV